MKGWLWCSSDSEAVSSSASTKVWTLRQATTIICVFPLAETVLHCCKIHWSGRKNTTLALLSSNFFRSLLLQIRLIHHLQFWKERKSFFYRHLSPQFFLFQYHKENKCKERDNLRAKAHMVDMILKKEVTSHHNCNCEI